MDKAELLSLIERSAETDVPTLLKAKEEAKRLMRDDPSYVGVFEKVSRLLEGRMSKESSGKSKYLHNVKEVLAYLQDRGCSIAKSKLYADVKSGFPNRLPDKTFALDEVDRYADTLPRVFVPDDEAGKSSELATAKAEAEVEKIKEDVAYRRIKRLALEKKLIPRDEVEVELAGRALVLDAGIKQSLELKGLDLIHLVGGDPKKCHQLLEQFEQIINEALNEYSKPMEFEVEITDVDGIAESELYDD